MSAAVPPVFMIFACVVTLTTAFWTTGLSDPDIKERVVTLKDGREIVCLVPSGFLTRSISCDWASAAEPSP